jgi:hypothetical protein
MAGKGENIALVDAAGDAAVIEKSGDRQAVRRPERDALYCVNHFLSPRMQGMRPLIVPGGISSERLEANSRSRVSNIERFLALNPSPQTFDALLGLLRRSRSRGGLCQHLFPNMVTHYAYVLLPLRREFWISQGQPCKTRFERFEV